MPGTIKVSVSDGGRGFKGNIIGLSGTLSPVVNNEGLSKDFGGVTDSCFSFSCLLSQFITVGGKREEKHS